MDDDSSKALALAGKNLVGFYRTGPGRCPLAPNASGCLGGRGADGQEVEMSVADIHPQQVMGRYVSACDPNKFVLDCSGLTSAAYRHRMHIRRQRGFPLVADIHPQPVVGRCVSVILSPGNLINHDQAVITKQVIPRTGIFPILRLFNVTFANRIGMNIGQLLFEEMGTKNRFRVIASLPDVRPAVFIVVKYLYPKEPAELSMLVQEILDLSAGMTLEIADDIGYLRGDLMTDQCMDVAGHDHVTVYSQPLVGLTVFKAIQNDFTERFVG